MHFDHRESFPLRATAAPVLAALLAAGPSYGQTPDKQQFGLANPPPRSLERPLSGDRPAVTLSPYTVDAGTVQLELSFVEFVNDGEDETLRIAPFNVKLGVTNNLDLQVLFDPYVSRDLPGSDSDNGIGDLTFRAKWNLWGNDSGPTSLAIMPYVRIPSSSKDLGTEEVEGGIIVPFRAKLNPAWTLGLMGEIDFAYDGDKDDYDTEFLHSAALFFAVDPELTLYGEYIGVVSTAGGDQYEISVGGGAQYLISDDMAIDLGMVLGLEGGADDFTIRTGLTVRF
jgi:hypothetical protein